MNVNILFYSTKCNYCYQFINLLKSENMLNYFKMICVDNNKNIPSIVTKVPTIIISKTNNIYMANEAFQWLNNLKNAKNTNIDSNQNSIKPYDILEMSGISDIYTYTEKDVQINKNFVFTGTQIQPIITLPEEKYKLSNEAQKDRINQLQKTRTDYDKIVGENMRNEQLDKIIKYTEQKIFIYLYIFFCISIYI